MSSFTVQIEDNPVKYIQIETSIGNNPASIEVQTFDNNIIQIESGLTFTPLEVANLLNARISQFLQAGSGIVLASGTDSLTIGLSNPNLQSSNILDFAQAVSGLLTITNVSAGSGISVTKSGTNYTVAVTGEFGLTPEQVDDRVSNLLLAGSNITLNYNDNSNTLTISTSGLQPSGNYSIVGHGHSINDITGLQTALDNKQPSGVYASGIHYHTSSDITNFDSSVSGLVYNIYAPLISPALTGVPTAPTAESGTNNTQIANTQFVRTEISNLVNAAPTTLDTLNELATALGNDPNFATTISNNLGQKANLSGATFTGTISGPSGNFTTLQQGGINVSVSGHTHSYTDITNFASGIDESVSTLLVAGNNINLNYDNINDTLTISATGLQPSGNYSLVGHTHTSSNITDFNTSVSGLLPVTNITGNSGIVLDKSGTSYNVSTSGLAYLSGANFTGNISAASGSFSGPIFASSGNFDSNLRVGNVPVSVSGHTHTLSSITDAGTAASRNTPSTGNAGLTEVVLGNDTRLSDQRVPTDGSVTAAKIAASQNVSFRTAVVRAAVASDTVLSALNVSGIPLFEVRGAGQINVYGSYLSVGDNEEFVVYNNGAVAVGRWEATSIAVAYGGTGATTAAAARTNLGVAYGATSGTVCQGNDSRLSDVRVPTAHKSTHAIGGADALTPTDIGAANASHTHTSSNITDFNSSVSGLLPVKDINSGTYINVTNNSGVYTVNSTGEANLLETTVFNKTGSSIPKLSVVYINGGQGDQPTIALASASGEMTSSKTYGITAENIDNMSTGKVIVAGALTGVNTDQFNPTAPHGDINGATLWLSPTVAGGLTRTKPSAPYHMVSVGTVVRTHQNEGVIEVRIQNGFELEELHNVAISGLSNNQFIKYDSSTSLWKNVTAIASDISDFNSSVSGLLPVTNILGGTNISVVPSGSSYTVSVSGQLGLTAEEVDDRVSGLLVAGSGINLSYNDNANALTISVSGLSSSSTIGNGVSGVINYDLSQTLNIVGSGSTSINYNNTSKTVTISSPSLIREYELINDNKSTFTVTGGYSLNNLDVYHNGIKLLASGDYSATNGSTFSLIQPAVSGDVVEWMGYSVVPRHQLILGEVRSDYVGDTNYIGRAVAGSSENANVWSIKKYVVNSNGIDIITTTASNVSWTNRLSATYV